MTIHLDSDKQEFCLGKSYKNLREPWDKL